MSLRKKLNEIAQPADLFPNLTRAEKECNRLLVAIANQIHVQRKMLGRTQKQLAEQLSVSQSMICQWESGDYNFSISSLTEIFDNLGLRVNLSFSLIEDKGILPSQSRYLDFEETQVRKTDPAEALDIIPEAA